MGNDFISSIWDFRGTNAAETGYATHDIFRWYGKLIPPLVSRLITMYSSEGETVLANFAGSGTILVEGNILSRECIGIDSNPLSVLLCRVKTSAYVPDHPTFLRQLRESSSAKGRPAPRMDDIDRKWFDRKTFQDLVSIRRSIQDLPAGADRDFYLFALAAIVFKASRTDSRCVNHIVLDEGKKSIDVYGEFEAKVKEMAMAIHEFTGLSSGRKVQISRGDARRLVGIEDGSIDLVISHPPYLGCINYSNIHQLANRLIGFPYEEVKENDISTSSLTRYMDDMRKVFDEMYRVLKNGRYACVVIGDNRKDGEIIPTFSYFIQYAKERGFRMTDIFIWVMSGKAGMNVKRRGNHIDHNYILVFQKA